MGGKPKTINSMIGSRIKLLRESMGLTQNELGKKVHKGESTVRMWELCKSEPDNETLLLLSNIFDVSTDYLLGREEKNLPIDRPYSELAENFIREYRELFSDEGFQNYARLYKVMTVRQRIFVLGMIVGWLKEQGVDLKNV